jgi:hypothetical protein
VPWTTAGFAPILPTTSSADLRALGLRSDRLVLLWLQNKAHTWWNVVHGEHIEPLRDGSVTIEGLADGEWTARFYDTWRGGWVTRGPCRVEGGRLELAVPELARDVAVWLER